MMRSDDKKFRSTSFTYKVALRISAICLFGCCTVLLFISPYWLSGIWTGLITLTLLYEAMRYVNRSERKLIAFLQSLEQNDFTITFSEDITSDDYHLHLAFNQLNQTFKNLRSERESQYQLLQVVVSHATVPLICFDEGNQEVYLINDAAKVLFRIPFLQKIDALTRIERGLPEFLKNMKNGQRASLKLVIDGKTVSLSTASTTIIFSGKNLKLIALTDVSSDLAAKEAEAWQKLLRVLTHEISNSAIPLSTLSSYIHDMMMQAESEKRSLSVEERNDVLESLRTIDQRSNSLKQFVRNFKNVNQIPEPEMMSFAIQELCSEIARFFARELDKQNIQLKTTSGCDVWIYADKILTMQVLINIIKNAMEAMDNMKADKTIQFSINKNGNQFVELLISDNGCGILSQDIEQIFVPFYSTKKGGSGIGLSIAHQIMQKQKGDLSVASEAGGGSTFTLSFIRANKE